MRRTLVITSIIILLLAGSTLVTWLVLSGRSGQGPQKEAGFSTLTSDTEKSGMTSDLTDQAQKQNITSSDTDEYISDVSAQKDEMTSDDPILASEIQNFAQKPTAVNANKETLPDLEAQPGGDTYSHFTSALYMGRRTGLIYQPMDISVEDLTGRDLTADMPIYRTLKNEYARKYELHAGATFMPSVLFYDPNPNNTGWSAGLDLQYSRSRLNVYAGIGVSRFRDKGSWQIQYETYDSVGYYTNVTSFRVHPDQPGKVIFETTQNAVYDSVPHLTIEERTNVYTYIDIPVGIGLDVYKNKRFSLAVKAGLKFSFLAGSEEPTVDISIAEASELNIHRDVPTRLNTTWRFTAGLEASYLLSDRLSMRLEPVYEQYLRSVYVNTPDFQAKIPYLIGVNVGIRYRIK
jgi:hypothetical protein